MSTLRDEQAVAGRWEDVLAAYAEAQERGLQPDREDWLNRFPDLASQLREYIDNQNTFERRFQPLRAALSTPPPPPDDQSH